MYKVFNYTNRHTSTVVVYLIVQLNLYCPYNCMQTVFRSYTAEAPKSRHTHKAEKVLKLELAGYGNV